MFKLMRNLRVGPSEVIMAGDMVSKEQVEQYSIKDSYLDMVSSEKPTVAKKEPVKKSKPKAIPDANKETDGDNPS